ncbi:MAG: hypothetical protein Q7R93_01025 [bacterium]|nr:hypothetical protein [bacterium]
MRDVEEVIRDLILHRAGIIRTLSGGTWSHFGNYFYIQEKYLKSDLDEEFRRRFCAYYVMNGARGLNKPQQSRYFKLLAALETNLKKALRTLFAVPGYGRRHKLFLSFTTKLLHTVDGKLPIYDGNIAHVLVLPKQISTVPLEEKIENRIAIYGELRRWFRASLKSPEVNRYLREMRALLRGAARKDHFEWKDNLLSDTKLLDSCLWALYSVLNK